MKAVVRKRKRLKALFCKAMRLSGKKPPEELSQKESNEKTRLQKRFEPFLIAILLLLLIPSLSIAEDLHIFGGGAASIESAEREKNAELAKSQTELNKALTKQIEQQTYSQSATTQLAWPTTQTYPSYPAYPVYQPAPVVVYPLAPFIFQFPRP